MAQYLKKPPTVWLIHIRISFVCALFPPPKIVPDSPFKVDLFYKKFTLHKIFLRTDWDLVNKNSTFYWNLHNLSLMRMLVRIVYFTMLLVFRCIEKTSGKDVNILLKPLLAKTLLLLIIYLFHKTNSGLESASSISPFLFIWFATILTGPRINPRFVTPTHC